MAERYPLEAARTVRDAELNAARVEVLRASEAVELAAGARDAAVAALDEHRTETRTVEAREDQRDAAGRAAEEMLRARAFLARRMTEEVELAAALRDADQALRVATDAHEASRAALADAKAAREAVERHHDKWQAAEKRKADARAEAEQDDVVAARHGRPDEG